MDKPNGGRIREILYMERKIFCQRKKKEEY